MYNWDHDKENPMDHVVFPVHSPGKHIASGVDPIARTAETQGKQSETGLSASSPSSKPPGEKETGKEILQAVELANTVADLLDKKISFHYDERIDQVIVSIVEGNSKEVIRQIPPEEIIELTVKLREDFRGLILDQKG
jgi:flagellar protein FlaG